MYYHSGLSQIEKTANAKHKGIFYYINRNKKIGKVSTRLRTAAEYMQLVKLLRRAHMIALMRKGKSH